MPITQFTQDESEIDENTPESLSDEDEIDLENEDFDLNEVRDLNLCLNSSAPF